MLLLCVTTLVIGAGIFLRISGDLGVIALDPQLLTAPLASLSDGDSSGIVSVTPEATITPSPTPTVTEAPTEPPIRTLTLSAVGQISVGSELRAAAKGADGTFAFDGIVSPVAKALSADLSIATLRTNLTDSTAAMNDYNAPVQLASGLASSGVNLFNLSTDRLLDHGTAGVSQTLDLLDGLGLRHTGAFRDATSRQSPQVLDIGGLKVGIVAYTGTISANGRKAASDSEIGVATRTLGAQAAVQDISQLRSAGADMVVVLAHWGNRSDSKPSNETREMAATLANAGADIILGTNPTSVHEVEKLTAQDGREVFVAYSLGNFLTDESRDTANITGMTLHLTVQFDTVSRRAAFTESWYMPTWIMRYKDSGGANRYAVVAAGSTTVPEGMTETIYGNMKKAYEGVVGRVGNAVAQPRTDP